MGSWGQWWRCCGANYGSGFIGRLRLRDGFTGELQVSVKVSDWMIVTAVGCGMLTRAHSMSGIIGHKSINVGIGKALFREKMQNHIWTSSGEKERSGNAE